MKKIIRFLMPLSITLAIISLSVLGTKADTSRTPPNVIYNSNQNIIGLKSVHIDGKVYYVQFIYGDLNEAYKETGFLLLNKIPDPVKATDAINQILNTLNPVPKAIARKPKNRKYPASYNNDSYMIPIKIISRTYQEKTGIEIRTLFSVFDPKTKQWQSSVVDDGIFQYEYKAHGPRTAGVYTKFEEVKMTK